jgi:spore maturation protein CgeB
VLFTETPYDIEQELRIAAMVDGCWTNERTAVSAFQAVNPRAGYLPHAWHPTHHYVSARAIGDVPSHDVVFVGSGFRERIAWFNAIDWTGIDLGLYGTWTGFGLKKSLKDCVKAAQVSNTYAAALYRRAKIGLNLYRTSKGFGKQAPSIAYAESLSPRAYELAACGAFHLSDYRAEVEEIFGDRVPTFSTPTEAAALIRTWLSDDAGRQALAAELPACVAASSWVERAACVIGDLEALLRAPIALSA